MSAPIQPYSDPRLYGTTLTKPFYQSYQWLNESFRPLPPNCHRVEECAMRMMKMATSMLAIAVTVLPALIGRVAQIIHFHALSVELRSQGPSLPAGQEFARTNVLVNLALQCLDSRDIAPLATVNKLFQKESLPAAHQEFKKKKVVSLRQLIDFATHKNKGVNNHSFAQISSDLGQMTGLDLSNWDFADNAYERLSSLTPERRGQIESLNFASTKNLTQEKAVALIQLIASPKLNYFNFASSNLRAFTAMFLAHCTSLQNGQATWIDQKGDKYEGNRANGLMSGEGTMTFADGHKYKGNWADSKASGQGTLTYADGEKYEGNWAEGKMSGEGTYTFANGNLYTGSWTEGRMNGPGTLTYSNGDSHTGNWTFGKRIGQGAYTYADGTEIKGHSFVIALRVSFHYQVLSRIVKLYQTLSRNFS